MKMQERGATAIFLAASLMFLLGAAALAVDTSGFYQQARSQQRAADLACLAGVIELPENPELAVEKAASFLRPNHPDLQSLPPTNPSSNGGVIAEGSNTWTHGAFEVEIQAPYGVATKMRVSIEQSRPTDFGRAIGAESVGIAQEALCEVGSALGGSQDMPFGVLAGFTGGILNYDNKGCTLNFSNTSECSGLAIPRHDDPTGSQFGVTTANNYIANMVSGINWTIFPPGATPAEMAAQDEVCRSVGKPQPGDNEPCNWVATVSGSDPSKVYRGLISGYGQYSPESEIGYLEKHSLVWEFGGDFYDSDDMPDVAACSDTDGDGIDEPEDCPTAHSSTQWTSQADVPTAQVTHVNDCECPRFARVPIVDSFPTADCTVTDPDDEDQKNMCMARIAGFQWVFILRPYYNGQGPSDSPPGPDEGFNDFDNAGSGHQVKAIAAVTVDFSSDVTVDGDCFSAFKQGAPKAVRLIDA